MMKANDLRMNLAKIAELTQRSSQLDKEVLELLKQGEAIFEDERIFHALRVKLEEANDVYKQLCDLNASVFASVSEGR